MNFKAMDSFLDSLIEYGIPGVDLLVMQDHEPIYRHSAGWRDREAGIPMCGDELYYVYSCSKVVTATAALQLFEQGKYLMNTPVYEFLPEFRDMTVRDRDGSVRKAQNTILMRHLFTMTAGLDYNLESDSIKEAQKNTGGHCPTLEGVRAIAKNPLSFEPGTHWQYSLCHDVLAATVEAISGKKFRDYVRENIFEPLGMTRSRYHASPDSEQEFAAQYRFHDDTRRAERIPLNNSYILGDEYDSGGAGMISCVEDYAAFTDAMACGGVGKTGEQILSRPTIDLMRTNHLGEAQLTDFNWIQMGGYGYGLGVRTVIDRTGGGGVLSPIGEFGWGGAAGQYVMIDPERRLSVFYGQHMLNNQEPYVHPRIRNILYACIDRKA